MAQSRIGLVLLTAGVTAFITSALWIGLGAAAYWYFLDEPPPFAVTISAPDTATTGEQIDLNIEVSNPTAETLELGSIDIYDTFIDGFAILSVDPPPDSRDPTFGFTSLYYSRSLAPGTSFKASLVLEAQSAGVWTGDIDCCTPLENFVTTSQTIVVTDPEPTAKAGSTGQTTTAPEREDDAQVPVESKEGSQ